MENLSKERSIAVVIPCYNEETQILDVLKGIPSFVRRIIVVNDHSSDRTREVVQAYIQENKTEAVEFYKQQSILIKNKFNEADIVLAQIKEQENLKFTPSKIFNSNPEKDRIILINHLVNAGVGASIATGYKWCLDHSIDCTAVMAGDGQMDPAELESICRPVVEEGIDYVKGNRLIHRSAWLVVPKVRYFGNSILSILTKIASGYWHVSDTQTGYTAISLKALKSIRIHKIYKSYGMPNDMLVKLNIAFCTLREVEIKPVYRVGEKSKMKIFKVIPRISLLLLRLFIQRLWIKYFFRDFHPLFLLYHFSFILGGLACWYLVKISNKLISGDLVLDITMMTFSLFLIIGFQSLFFAMWMDIQDNQRLYSR